MTARPRPDESWPDESWPDGSCPGGDGFGGLSAAWTPVDQDQDGPGAGRMYEDDPRWQSPAQPHGLTRLQRDPDVGGSGDLTDPYEHGAELWTVRRPGESWAGATVQRWCADCLAWTHVVDAGVPVDWDLDDRCGSCGRGFPLDPTA